mgnify:CR=1 FL=1
MDPEDCTLVYFILAFLRGKAYSVNSEPRIVNGIYYSLFTFYYSLLFTGRSSGSPNLCQPSHSLKNSGMLRAKALAPAYTGTRITAAGPLLNSTGFPFKLYCACTGISVQNKGI